jgi:two-component system, sensor histidine kinase RegB
MNQLSSLAQSSSTISSVALSDLLSDLRDHYAINSPGAIPHFTCAEDLGSLTIRCNALFQYALINLINNAIESDGQPATIAITQKQASVQFLITNSSAASDQKIAQKWGRLAVSDKGNGLGIGSFLANSTIEKQGGLVELLTSSDTANPGQTAITVVVSIPIAGAQT